MILFLQDGNALDMPSMQTHLISSGDRMPGAILQIKKDWSEKPGGC